MTRHIHIHIHRSSTKDAWNEADHPRAANGQFGSGGGGAKPAAVQARIEAKRAAGQPVGFERVRKEVPAAQKYSSKLSELNKKLSSTPAGSAQHRSIQAEIRSVKLEQAKHLASSKKE